MPRRSQREQKGKGGRPKGKPLSAKERAQRRAAAVKTGEYATTALAQALPPCKPAVCPNGTGTCDVKRAIEAQGAGLSACLASLGQHEVMQKYLAAIQSGDLSGIAELAATSLASQVTLAHGELAVLMQEGLVAHVPVVGRNAEGELEVVAELLRQGESLESSQPVAIFSKKDAARLAAAVLPSTGRRSRYRLGKDSDGLGYPVYDDTQIVGHFERFHEDLVVALNVDALVSSPGALAWLVDAAGGLALAHAGKIAVEHTLPEF